MFVLLGGGGGGGVIFLGACRSLGEGSWSNLFGIEMEIWERNTSNRKKTHHQRHREAPRHEKASRHQEARTISHEAPRHQEALTYRTTLGKNCLDDSFP